MTRKLLLAALAAFVLVSTVTAQVTSQAKAKSTWDASGRLQFWHPTTYERLLPIASVSFYDDFLGYKLNKYVSGEQTGAAWTVAETNINTTTALVSNEINGVVALIGDSDDNAETCTLYWGDHVSLSALQNLVMECRVTCHVLPTAQSAEVSEIAWGLTSAIQSTLDDAATNMQFKVVGSATSTLLWESDDGTTDDDDNDASTTLVADTYIVTRIECIGGTYARFYVNGALVGQGNISKLTTSTDNVQPFFRYIKARSSANNSVGTLYVDYCRVWQDRE